MRGNGGHMLTMQVDGEGVYVYVRLCLDEELCARGEEMRSRHSYIYIYYYPARMKF